MAKIRIIKKNNDCSMEYEVGDICEVTGTWYGGVHINGRSGIPVSLDKVSSALSSDASVLLS